MATYNVLATAYLGKGRYRTPPELLRPERRIPALAEHVAGLSADLLCLQEVEPQVFATLEARLDPLGYAGCYEQKGRGRPDGCATFYRRSVFTFRGARRLEYHDTDAPGESSGTIALLLTLGHAGRLLGVANTHLRWDPPATRRDRQVGFREAVELIAGCRCSEPSAPASDAWMVCGDFNRTAESDVPSLLREAGYTDAHAGRPAAHSAVSNGKAKRIDFIFVGSALRARPIDPPEINDRSVLPSEVEPSDHLALLADVDWASVDWASVDMPSGSRP